MKLRYLIAILAAIVIGSLTLAGGGWLLDRADVAGKPNTILPPATYDDDSSDDEDEDDEADEPAYCSNTAQLQFWACKAEVKDDFLEAKAKCIQVVDDEERGECVADAKTERKETLELCGEQRQARWDLCDLIGEERYDPDFDPELYIDDYQDPAESNPYYPLVIGYVWEYEADGEGNVIEVLNETKNIEGVTCVVINDFVTVDDGSGEDTDDWYAQQLDTTVTYCGENVADFEVFEGDVPQKPETTSIDGSFKHGRDGDLAGTIMLANPMVGDAYRQEMSLGNAEDAAIIQSTTYGWGGGNGEFDAFAPQELVELMCPDNDCVVIGEINTQEPGIFDLKYYAYGVGLFLEVKPADGEINQLVACNFDPRCDDLPEP